MERNLLFLMFCVRTGKIPYLLLAKNNLFLICCVWPKWKKLERFVFSDNRFLCSFIHKNGLHIGFEEIEIFFHNVVSKLRQSIVLMFITVLRIEIFFLFVSVRTKWGHNFLSDNQLDLKFPFSVIVLDFHAR